MKLGQLADQLRELDILTQRLAEQIDWLGRFERQGDAAKIEAQTQQVEAIQKEIMMLRETPIVAEKDDIDNFINLSGNLNGNGNLNMSGDAVLCAWWAEHKIPVDPQNCSQGAVYQARRLMQLEQDVQQLRDRCPHTPGVKP